MVCSVLSVAELEFTKIASERLCARLLEMGLVVRFLKDSTAG
jgi:hypothetical protein